MLLCMSRLIFVQFEQLYGSSKTKKPKEDSASKEIKHCTFQPKLETEKYLFSAPILIFSSWKKLTPKGVPKGYIETVSRVRRTGEPNPLSYAEQYRQSTEKRAVQPPLVYVDVNLGQR
jgi:hypothetical protein